MTRIEKPPTLISSPPAGGTEVVYVQKELFPEDEIKAEKGNVDDAIATVKNLITQSSNHNTSSIAEQTQLEVLQLARVFISSKGISDKQAFIYALIKEGKATARKYGIPEEIINENSILVGLSSSKYGSFSPNTAQVFINIDGYSPYRTLHHELRHFFDFIQKTILSKSNPNGCVEALKEEVVSSAGLGGKRAELGIDEQGYFYTLVDRLKYPEGEIRDGVRGIMNKYLESKLTPDSHIEIVNEVEKFLLGLNPKDMLLLKQLNFDVTKIIEDITGEIRHFDAVKSAFLISDEALKNNPALGEYIKVQVEKRKQVTNDPLIRKYTRGASRAITATLREPNSYDLSPDERNARVEDLSVQVKICTKRLQKQVIELNKAWESRPDKTTTERGKSLAFDEQLQRQPRDFLDQYSALYLKHQETLKQRNQLIENIKSENIHVMK